MMPTSISQIIEQVFNAAFSIGAAWFFIQQFATNDTEHAKFGAAGGTLGTGAGVLAGLCFMLIVYGVNRKTILRKVARDTRHREESYREIFQVLFLMVTPRHSFTTATLTWTTICSLPSSDGTAKTRKR